MHERIIPINSEKAVETQKKKEIERLSLLLITCDKEPNIIK